MGFSGALCSLFITTLFTLLIAVPPMSFSPMRLDSRECHFFHTPPELDKQEIRSRCSEDNHGNLKRTRPVPASQKKDSSSPQKPPLEHKYLPPSSPRPQALGMAGIFSPVKEKQLRPREGRVCPVSHTARLVSGVPEHKPQPHNA